MRITSCNGTKTMFVTDGRSRPTCSKLAMAKHLIRLLNKSTRKKIRLQNYLPQNISGPSSHGMLLVFPCRLSSEMESSLQISYLAENLLIYNGRTYGWNEGLWNKQFYVPVSFKKFLTYKTRRCISIFTKVHPVLNLVDPVHIFMLYISEIHFNFTFLPMARSFKRSLPLRIPEQNFVCIPQSNLERKSSVFIFSK